MNNAVADVALGALLICGFFDFHEDLHILTMLRNATHNLPIEESEIAMQMLFSMIKFCASYFGFFLLSFIVPSQTFSENFLRYSLMFFFVPIGALVYTAPESIQPLFGLIRFIFMAIGFLLLAYNFSKTE